MLKSKNFQLIADKLKLLHLEMSPFSQLTCVNSVNNI